ncbi:hypothetical protein GW17_00035501 [Ensete ventricosum]|nr:hypothetical protein GW17_00035501 [Ensete ventricosum]
MVATLSLTTMGSLELLLLLPLPPAPRCSAFVSMLCIGKGGLGDSEGSRESSSDNQLRHRGCRDHYHLRRCRYKCKAISGRWRRGRRHAPCGDGWHYGESGPYHHRR